MDELIPLPITTISIILMILIYVFQCVYNIDLDTVAVSYNSIVIDKQYYRILTSSYTHANILHLVMNLFSFYSLNWLEQLYGSIVYLEYIYLLLILNPCIQLLIQYLLINYFNGSDQYERRSVG